MEFAEVKELLSGATRSELRDHAFGDREVFWTKDGEEIAGGYFGGNTADVWIGGTVKQGGWTDKFSGDEARQLAELGTLGVVERNDETGPDQYVEGQIMQGLTIEDVRNELTGG